MGRRLAIIDLGTNTFHTLIVEAQNSDWQVLHQQRIFVNLAESGIEHISESAWQRGHDALQTFMQAAQQLETDAVRAVGTAALRHARNAPAFIRSVNALYGLDVEVISGHREAELIAKGVQLALPHESRPLMVLDIGGGSIEIIIMKEGIPLFIKSYPIGIALLHEKFHRSEPISVSETEALRQFLEEQFTDLRLFVNRYDDIMLVGAAGSFEVIDILSGQSIRPVPHREYDYAIFMRVYERIIPADLEERLHWKEVPQSRARYLVVAMLLIKYLLDLLPAQSFKISDYAMKEGLVYEYLNKFRLI